MRASDWPEGACLSVMRLIFKTAGLIWTFLFVLFFVVHLYSGCCGDVPPIAQWYSTSFESLLMSFLGSYWFLFLFLCAWLGISSKLSSNSGWKTLSDKYGIKSVLGNNLDFRAVSGYLGEVRYEGSLKIAITAQGIYLKVLFLFKFGHRDLFIPWSDFTTTVDKKGTLHETAPEFLNRLTKRLSRSSRLRVHLKDLPDRKLILEVPDSLVTRIPSEIMESNAK